MKNHLEFVNPAHFSAPKGYANGVISTGRTLYVAGQVGWDSEQKFPSKEFPGQFKKALENVVDVVRAAGGNVTNLAKMTVYVTDVDAYRASVKEVGASWRDVMGKHFPAMALIGVNELVEREALVEIEAIAVLPESSE